MKCATHHNKCPAKKASLSATVANKWASLTEEQKRENARGLFDYRDGGENHQEIVNKARKTRIENGTYLNPDDQSEYKKYRTEVRRLTGQNYRRHKYTVNPDDLPRGRDWHVDHQLSIAEGFEQGIDASLIAHPANLRMLPGRVNRSKNRNSSITLEILISLVRSWP